MSARGRYGSDLAAVHAAGFTALARNAAAELLARLPAPARIVELGCGDGTSARLLTAAGHRVHAVDLSPAMIALARRRAPRATFVRGSFLDARLPPCDAVLAAGEVLGYALDERVTEGTLQPVLARIAAALAPGGLLLFDLAGPGRAPAGGASRRAWSEGRGWAVLAETSARDGVLTRRIVTFRRGTGGYRRSVESHRLVLHAPAAVLSSLRAAGFSARTLPGGYAGDPAPPGLTVYVARRRQASGANTS